MNETVPAAERPDAEAAETLAVHAWRAEQLRGLGVPALVAEMFADDVDWHTVSALVDRGCPLGLALAIVR